MTDDVISRITRMNDQLVQDDRIAREGIILDATPVEDDMWWLRVGCDDVQLGMALPISHIANMLVGSAVVVTGRCGDHVEYVGDDLMIVPETVDVSRDTGLSGPRQVTK